MENTYGIGVTNRYALFLDEAEDPLEVLKIQEQEKEAKKKTKLSEKENKGKTESKGKPLQASRKGIKDTQNVKTLESGKPKEETVVKSKPLARTVQERTDKSVKFAGSESREDFNNKRNREDRQPAIQSEFGREGREQRDREVREKGDGSRPDFGDSRGRGRGANRVLGRGRGTRGGGRGTYDNRGKREYDRQSGSDKTGVKPVDKREGGGAHNWGNHKDDIAEQLNTTQLSDDHQDWTNEKSAPDTQSSETVEKEAETGVNDVDPEAAQHTEEEPKELTLDEYKALRGNRQKPTFNLRKAGEGEDLSQWKKMYALNKKKEGEEEEDEEDVRYLVEYDASDYPQRVGRQKHLLDIDIHFADTRRGTRSRGRGGPRAGGGGGSRGGGVGPTRGNITPGLRGAISGGETRQTNIVRDRDRMDRPEREPYQNRATRQSAPKVDDEHDFPSLG